MQPTDIPAGRDTGFVQVRGAREHNLKNVDLDVPRDALVVFTGVSGSGKSSLAFGTLYAEAQRRYLESVAPYARRLFEQMGAPEVDSIEGLPPAVALQQQRGAPTSRSSVGSVTTLSNLLRMLYSRAGTYPPRQPLLYAESFSPNTPEGACPTCHGLGRVYEVTEASMVPDDALSIRERAIAAWPTAWHGQNLRDISVTLGFDIDRPWRELPKKDREWLLFTEEQPVVPVYAGFEAAEVRRAIRRKDEPSYQGTFTSARRYVLHTFANTQSPSIKRRVAQFMISGECSLCGVMSAILTISRSIIRSETFSPCSSAKAWTARPITITNARLRLSARRKRASTVGAAVQPSCSRIASVRRAAGSGGCCRCRPPRASCPWRQ